ncbi:hypothetical protein SAMD00019534_121370, partial [Acytostelium subglobosum LB1]|uniref:hypothetical protein n=1 Tax=Acytostelium subglobosum LB1 TaxID=1410327 RepID=UPI00064497A7
MNISSLENRLNIPVEPQEEDFNYQLDGSDKIDVNSFDILSTVGNGSYGEVFVVKQKSSVDKVYALKKIPYVGAFDSELI